MKKIFISLLAVAALAACSKSEVQYEPAGKISFAPVASTITKAVAGVEDNTFPTDLNLYVFANAQADDLSAAWPATYFSNAEFIYNRLDNGIYEGKTPRYWPNVKSLVFAGYSSACNIASVAANSTMDFDTNTLTINGYTQDNTKTAAGANDLMWFPWDNKSYTKEDKQVPALMKHACSWITVKVLSDGHYADLKLHDLTINGLYKTGNATCTATEATWVTSGEASAENLYTSAGESVSTTASVFENTTNNMVVLPQIPTSIDVTYSFVPESGAAPISETKKGLDLKISDTASENVWKSGTHYIYTITITATEILIAPTVETWNDVEVTPGTTI